MFGERLKELRKNAKLTQEELAIKLNVTKPTISCWEVRRTQPTIEQIIELSEIFGVSIDYLLGITKEDISEMEKLKRLLREIGLLNAKNNDMTKEDLEKALEIVEILKRNNK